MQCELCGHGVYNHCNEGCMAYLCECKRTWKPNDHPSYREQADRIAELESIVKNFDAFVAALAAIGPHAGKPDSHIEALLDKVKRVSELEQTERELREAVKVLAESLSVCNELRRKGSRMTYTTKQTREGVCGGKWANVLANPIAAAAVREAGK